MDKMTLLSGYADVKYVDAIIGDDVTGNGTESKPYKTILKASQSVTMDDTMIYVAREGAYKEDNLNSILNLNYKVTFATVTITQGNKKVYLILDRAPGQYTVMNKENTFIGFILQRNNLADLRLFAYFYDASTINISFNNCVFDKVPHSPTGYVIYTGNSKGANITKLDYVNCSLLPTTFSQSRTNSGYLRGNFIQCAIADSNLTPETGNILNATFDPDFHLLTTLDTVGVYAGIYAWTIDDAKTLVINNGKYKKYLNGLWVEVSTVTPTEQEFKTHGMSITSLNGLNRELISQSDSMISQGTLGSGKLFKSIIDLNKHFHISQIEIK